MRLTGRRVFWSAQGSAAPPACPRRCALQDRRRVGLASTALRERNEGSHLWEAGLGLGRLPLLKTAQGCVWGAGGGPQEQ